MMAKETMEAAYSLSSFSIEANMIELNPTGAEAPISTMVLMLMKILSLLQKLLRNWPLLKSIM